MQMEMLQALQAQKLELERHLLLRQRSMAQACTAQAATSYTQGHILADFDGTAYGPEYLCLARAEEVRSFGPSKSDPGWSFGERVRDGARGCFPTEYFAISQTSTTGSASVASSSQWTQANSPAQVSLAPASAQSEDASVLPAARSSLREVLRVMPPPEISSDQEDDAQPGASLDDRSAAQVCSPATTTYGRDFLLSIGSAIEAEGLDHPVLASMAASTLGRRKRSKKDAATLKSIILLLQAAGGSVRISNLRAACISLSIMNGNHQQVYEDLRDLMAAHPQYFEPPSSTSEQHLRDQFVRLCPKLCEEALMAQSMQQGSRSALLRPSEDSIVLQI